jgi:hypothetical protein
MARRKKADIEKEKAKAEEKLFLEHFKASLDRSKKLLRDSAFEDMIGKSFVAILKTECPFDAYRPKSEDLRQTTMAFLLMGNDMKMTYKQASEYFQKHKGEKRMRDKMCKILTNQIKPHYSPMFGTITPYGASALGEVRFVNTTDDHVIVNVSGR